MADNSQYAFGMDWYEGNRVSSWPALVQWDKNLRFAYFRLGIGYHADDLALLKGCDAQTMWALGGFYEVGLPVIPKDSMVKVLRDQLAACGSVLSLPVSLAFEPQGWVGKTPLWPSVGDLKYIGQAIANLGYKVNIYTNESGLKIIRASGLIDLASADWWYSSTLAFPLWSTERSVDSVLTFLQANYGIQREHVQFMQTLIDHGNSPIGTGQDFDRAVSWSFEEVPAPEPEPEHTITISVRSDRAELIDVKYDGRDPTEVVIFTVEPYPPTPEPSPQPEPAPEPEPAPSPEPEPEPQVEDEIQYGILRQFGIDNGLTRAGQLTPAIVRINDEPTPGPVGQELKKGAPSPVTESRRAFVVAINDAEGAHYVNETVGKMLINSPGLVESVSSVRNFVSWPKAGVKDGCAPLQCFQSSEDFGKFIDANGKPTVTWQTRPDLILKCGAVNLAGDKYINVGEDVDAFSPLTARSTEQGGTGELWLDLDAIEPFPALPCDVVVLPDRIGTDDHLYLRNGPAGDILDKFDAGTVVTLYEYRPLGADVWARTKGGWICLLQTNAAGPHFLTSWRIETPPVIPPEA